MSKALEEELAKQEQGEPVAWLWKHINRDGEELNAGLSFEKVEPTNNTFWMNPNDPRLTATEVQPLYTTPQQRTWVGLTDEEENELWESTDSDWELMKRTEAKLKEKNT